MKWVTLYKDYACPIKKKKKNCDVLPPKIISCIYWVGCPCNHTNCKLLWNLVLELPMLLLQLLKIKNKISLIF
jgi:hypothetical protein